MTVKNARKQKRKEDRMLAIQRKHKFWLEHQKLRKLGKNILTNDVDDFDGDAIVKKKPEDILKPDISSKSMKKNVKGLKTKFEEYLDLESKGPSAEEDLEMERRLAKKLKVKNGKLGNDEDDINILLGVVDQEYDEQLDKIGCVKISKDKKKKIKTKKTLKQENEVSHAKPKVISVMENDIEIRNELGEDGEVEVSEADLKTGTETKVVKKEEKKVKENRKKTKFEEYLAIENTSASTAEDDLNLERRLAKKLKMKDGRLPSDDDGINFLFQDSEQDYAQRDDYTDSMKNIETNNKKKKKKKETVKQDMEATRDDTSDILHENLNPTCLSKMANAKSDNANNVAPHLRACSSIDSNENLPTRRQIRRLLNLLSQSNVESTSGEISAVFQSIERSVASQIVAEEALAICAGGPHDSQQRVAVFAAFLAGLTCMVGIDFGAKLLASLAKSFEKEYTKEDDLSLRNLTLLLSYLYLSGVCSSDLIYDFLMMPTKQMLEIDVETIRTVLECCGMKLRSDDPATMKEFILGVQSRVTEVKEVEAASKDHQANTTSRRAILLMSMLKTISDIKNNKKRKEELTQHTHVKKWLQKLRVDDFAIRGIKWSTLVDPDKKGQWWLTGDLASSTDNVELVANSIDKEVLEAQKMLELAASQRMNTDIRKAIFCVIMSGEDYVDAFEKLMRLDLQGKQDREIMRVLLECCLQEKIFNKYYSALAVKLCRHEKNHKFTLQYCVWDQFKELDRMPLVRSMHLAKFLAEMLASYTLSMAVIKVVDLGDISQLSPRRIMHFRMLFDTVLGHPDNVVWNIFTRIAVTPELESLRSGMEFFIIKHVLPSNDNVKHKFKLAKKALNNAEGVLM